MDRLNDKACRRPEVPLRALWCKLIGGVAVACGKLPREEKQEKIYTELLILLIAVLVLEVEL
jgi:hypothetical protein